MHGKVKETAKKRRICSVASCVESKDGTIDMEKSEKEGKNISKNSSIGPYDVAIELIQAMDDLGVEWITAIANKIYDEGHFPLDMRRSTFTALPKKPGTAKCKLHCTIGLMSHIANLMFKMLLCRMRGRTKGVMSEEQVGSAENQGTRMPYLFYE